MSLTLKNLRKSNVDSNCKFGKICNDSPSSVRPFLSEELTMKLVIVTRFVVVGLPEIEPCCE